MTRDKPDRSQPARGEPVRQRVLDVAEWLLRDGKAEFSMRDLATEAGVSFATPFNQFGSKAAIMHALSGRRIDTMTERFAAVPHPTDIQARVALAVETAVTVILEEPVVNRAVMGWMGTGGPARGDALARSQALWALALDLGDGNTEGVASDLARHLALAFRGVLSFWSAGELADETLGVTALDITGALLSSSPDRGRRQDSE